LFHVLYQKTIAYYNWFDQFGIFGTFGFKKVRFPIGWKFDTVHIMKKRLFAILDNLA